jgi:hypothetical protein
LAWLRWRRTDGVQNLVVERDWHRLAGLERASQPSGRGIAKRDDASRELDGIAGTKAIEIRICYTVAERQLRY